MIKPFEGDYKLTQKFGVNPQYYVQFLVLQPDGTRAPLKGHNGIDWALPNGTNVISPISGRVIEAAYDPRGYGNYLKIENEKEGVVLAHLQNVLVGVGLMVKQGQLIATSDNTGYSTGPHLHLGFYQMPRDRGNGFGGFIDPEPFLTPSSASPSGQVAQKPVSGALYTQEQYDAVMKDREKFWKERDEQIALNEKLTNQLKELSATVSAFGAAGYNSVEDIKKALDPYKELQAHGIASADELLKERTKLSGDIEGLNKELIQVLDRNKDLVRLLEEKENEDSTAIELGVRAMRELEEIKKGLTQVKRVAEVNDPENTFSTFLKLVGRILTFKRTAEKLKAQAVKAKLPLPEQVEAKAAKPGWASYFGLGLFALFIPFSVYFLVF